MDFTIPEELRLLQQTVRRFIQDELVPLEQTHQGGLSVEEEARFRRQTRDMGLFMMHVPEEYGGGGVGTLGMALVYEQTSKTILSAEYLLGIDQPNPAALLGRGSPEIAEKYLRPAVRGERYWGFAISEANAGSDPASMETTAVRDGDEWVLNGTKLWVSRMSVADFVIVFAVTDKTKRARGGITAFVFDTNTPGFKVVRRIPTMSETENDRRGPTELVLENVRIPAYSVLGEVGEGFKLAQGRLGAQRTAIAARCVGMSERALDMAIEYAKQRVTFGDAVANRQGIQWYFADAAVNIHAARLMNYHCAWEWDNGLDVRQEASIVKLFASEMVSKIIDMAIQVHGGIGYTKELPLEWMYRYSRMFRIVEGASEIHKNVIARGLLQGKRASLT
ncbi:MAG: acyl-CoA dehydrogenase family protein [Chloroflexi bacterium]|nr:acyl-CoA dehydrogenase family protein [Chloroflexota bacterium]